jgi:DNA-binding transcriptional regulator YiaG
MEINVRELRESVGLSREIFARQLGVSSLSVFNWEAGKTRPSQLAREKLFYLKQAVAKIKRNDTAGGPGSGENDR